MGFVHVPSLAATGPDDLLLAAAATVAAGLFILVISERLRIPPIAPLLLGGILLGPQGAAVIRPSEFGASLQGFIGFSVAVILFEGGLSLDMAGFRRSPGAIPRLLTIGSLTTWLGTAGLAHVFLRFDASLCLLIGSLVIVTGPTVVTPILRRIRVEQRLHNILHWEAVLNDPFGVFIAVFCFEFLHSEAAILPASNLAIRLASGAGLGIAGGLALDLLFRRNWVSSAHTNIAALGACLSLFGISEYVLSEAGLLTVTVAGLVLGFRNTPGLGTLKQFKLELTEFLVATLFVLLAANLDLHGFEKLGFGGIALVAALIFVVRPVGIWLSTIGCGIRWQGRVFLAWLAPRGIVAASMATLFTIALRDRGHPNAQIVESFVFATIITTVILQGFSARIVGRLLGVLLPDRSGWLLIGARMESLVIARALASAGVDITLIDRNPQIVQKAVELGLEAYEANALDRELLLDGRFIKVGNVLATTENDSLNRLACLLWSEVVGRENVYRWAFPGEGETQVRRELGKPVWSALGEPETVQERIVDRALAIERVDEPMPGTDQILFQVKDGKATLLAEPAAPAGGAQSYVVARRYDEQLDWLIRDVIFFPEAAGEAEVVRALARRAAALEVGVDVDRLLGQLAPTEDGSIPRIVQEGSNVALCHARDDALARPLAVVGVVGENGPPAGSDRTHLYFFLLSPKEKPQQHLVALAALAHLAVHIDRTALLQGEQGVATLIHEIFRPDRKPYSNPSPP